MGPPTAPGLDARTVCGLCLLFPPPPPTMDPAPPGRWPLASWSSRRQRNLGLPRLLAEFVAAIIPNADSKKNPRISKEDLDGGFFYNCVLFREAVALRKAPPPPQAWSAAGAATCDAPEQWMAIALTPPSSVDQGANDGSRPPTSIPTPISTPTPTEVGLGGSRTRHDSAQPQPTSTPTQPNRIITSDPPVKSVGGSKPLRAKLSFLPLPLSIPLSP